MGWVVRVDGFFVGVLLGLLGCALSVGFDTGWGYVFGFPAVLGFLLLCGGLLSEESVRLEVLVGEERVGVDVSGFPARRRFGLWGVFGFVLLVVGVVLVVSGLPVGVGAFVLFGGVVSVLFSLVRERILYAELVFPEVKRQLAVSGRYYPGVSVL